jgi:osmotically-inducible protein OsmY
MAVPVVAMGLLAAGFAPGSAAQDPGTAERVGAQVDDLLNRLQQNFRDLSDDVRRRFAEAQQRVDGLGVEARVYSRIHWDKALSEADIAVEVREGNLVVLHGSVADAELRRKAVRLAVETVGVERVEDSLRVAEPEELGRSNR